MLVFGLLALFGWQLDRDPIVDKEVVYGQVIHWSQVQRDDAMIDRLIEMRLHNGKSIVVTSGSAVVLVKGQTARIVKRTRTSGAISYEWLGPDRN